MKPDNTRPPLAAGAAGSTPRPWRFESYGDHEEWGDVFAADGTYLLACSDGVAKHIVAAVNAYTAPAADRKKIIARVRQIASELHREGCYAEGDDLTQFAALLENNPAPAAGDWARKNADQIAFDILTKHPEAIQDDVPLDDLIKDIGNAINDARHCPAPGAIDVGTTNLIVEEYFANGYEGQDEAEDELRRILAKHRPAHGAREGALEKAAQDLEREALAHRSGASGSDGNDPGWERANILDRAAQRIRRLK